MLTPMADNPGAMQEFQRFNMAGVGDTTPDISIPSAVASSGMVMPLDTYAALVGGSAGASAAKATKQPSATDVVGSWLNAASAGASAYFATKQKPAPAKPAPQRTPPQKSDMTTWILVGIGVLAAGAAVVILTRGKR